MFWIHQLKSYEDKKQIVTLKKINKMKIIIIKEKRMHTYIVLEFRHSHIEISFTPKGIYRVIYIGRVPFEI